MSERKHLMNRQSTMMKKQPNALLTFVGEQDLEFFAAACDAVSEKAKDDSGGSREVSIRAENDRLVIGYKTEMTV